MSADSQVECPSCGAISPGRTERCTSCGHAPDEELSGRDRVLDEILGAAVLQPSTSVQGLPRLTPSLARPERVQSAVSKTLELDPFETESFGPLSSRHGTAVEGVPAVGRSSVTMEVDALVEPPSVLDQTPANSAPPHNHVIQRVLPLAVISGLAIGIVSFVAYRIAQQDSVDQSAETQIVARSEAPIELTLPAVTTTVGLTDDNKEAYLALCFRVSERPQVECRVSYLRDSGEYPAESVEVPSLTADALEVSNTHFAMCVADGECDPIDYQGCRFYSQRGFEFSVPVPASFELPSNPAVCVSYEEATRYCGWRGMRLPTRTEWERLARGSGDALFPWRGSYWAPGILNWGERDMTSYPIPGRLDGAEFTTVVTSYEDGATAEGLYNLLGNAAEWVWPDATTTDGEALIMGGSYVDDIRTLRVTAFEAISMTQRRSTVGFRCVGDPE